MASLLALANKNQNQVPAKQESPFDAIVGDNRRTEDVAITDTSTNEAKPFFYARCRDCNIALGEKEIMSFLQDIVEMMGQPEQNYFTNAKGKRAFDGECVNCNLLLGGTEALTAAANSMFNSMKGNPKSHRNFP